MNSDGTGTRHNIGKLRYDLLPSNAVKDIVQVFTYGSKKYDDNNWKKGMNWSIVYGSLSRHLAEYNNGEDYDPESGELHMAHVATNAIFLLEYYSIYPQGDNRMLEWKKEKRHETHTHVFPRNQPCSVSFRSSAC